MPYVSTMEIYQDGLKQGYGTPMFNCINYEMIRWAIETAEEEGMPVLIGHYFGFETNMDPAIAELVTKHYAQRCISSGGQTYTVIIAGGVIFLAKSYIDSVICPAERKRLTCDREQTFPARVRSADRLLKA